MKFYCSLIICFIFLSCSQESSQKKGKNKGDYFYDPYNLKERDRLSNEIIAINRGFVSQAAEFMEEGKIYSNNGKTPSNCSYTSFEYSLQKKEEKRVELILKVFLDFSQSPSDVNRNKVLLKEINSCNSFHQKFFKRYNIDFKLEYKSSMEVGRYDWDWDEAAYVIDESFRTNSRKWSSDHTSSCSVILHELGHHLGLPDEYYEEDSCRKRKFEAQERMPFSLMQSAHFHDKDGQNYHIDDMANFHFLPRHILALIDQVLPSELEIKWRAKNKKENENEISEEEHSIESSLNNNENSFKTFNKKADSNNCVFRNQSILEDLFKNQESIVLIERHDSNFFAYRDYGEHHYNLRENSEVRLFCNSFDRPFLLNLDMKNDLFEVVSRPFSASDHLQFPPLFFKGQD